MMKREEMDEMVMDYLYDELSDAKRASFEKALPSFPELSEEVRGTTSLRTALRSIAPEPVPPSLTKSILQIAEQESFRPQKAKPGFLDWLAGFVMQPAFATAMVFLVVGSTTLLLNQDETPLTDPAFESTPEVAKGLQPPVPDRFAAATRAPAPQPAANREALAPAAKEARVAAASPPGTPRVQAATRPKAASRRTEKGRLRGDKHQRSPKMAKNLRAKKDLNIRLAESKQRLFEEGTTNRADRGGAPEKARKLPQMIAAASEPKVMDAPASHAPISLGTGKTKGPAVAKKRGKEKSTPQAAGQSGKTDKRLVAAFERALKKRQFGEARKLLGLIGKRPGLKGVYKSKRKRFHEKKKEALKK